MPLKKITAALLLFSIVLFSSCRKEDRLRTAERNAIITERFFSLPPATKPEVQRVATAMKNINAKTGFIAEMATKHGYALWDKALVGKQSKKPTKAFARTNGSADTIIYIPLVLENANHVNAFIYAILNDSISLRFYRETDYASFNFGSLLDSLQNAEKLALQFMLLDYKTFGHKDFKILNDSLFKNSSIAAGTPTKAKTLHISPLHNQANSRFEIWQFTSCARTTVLRCNTPGQCCSDGSCSGCQENCWRVEEDCKVTSFMVHIDEGDRGGGGGSTDPGETGGGGSTGTGTTGPTPCNPTPFIDNGLLPCPKGGTSGWILLDPTNPCDQVKAIINDATNGTYVQKVKDLASPQNLNINYEKSVALVEGSTPNIKEASGTTAVANVDLPDLPSGQKYKSFAHTHPNTSDGTYSVFSLLDLTRMSMLLHKSQLESNKFVIFLSTYKGTHYALTINDKTKFETFFYYYNNKGEGSNMFEWLDSYNKASKIQNKYFQDATNALITETDTNNSNVLDKFLDFMIEADLGVTLFETNANFDSFAKVEKDETGAIKRTNCN